MVIPSLRKTALKVTGVILLAASLQFLSPQPQTRADTIHRRAGRSTVVDMWVEVEQAKKEVLVKKIYPLKSLDDLKEILFVAVHPFNFVEGFRVNWERIFEDYNVQFLDRGTAFNDISMHRDPRNVEFARRNKILIASYFSLHPLHLPGHWSFIDKYYKSLPQSEMWRDFTGSIVEDPYQWAGAKDISGKVLKWGNGQRIVMSLNSPDWFNYQAESAKYAIDAGINAIDTDLMIITPFSEKGGFSEWSIRDFNQHLESKFTKGQLRRMGITNVSRFDIKGYIIDEYVKKAIRTIMLPDSSKFFNTEPLDKPLNDPLVREFVRFNYHTLIDFNRKLSSRVKEYGLKKGMVIPYFGNLNIGHPGHPLGCTNNSVLLGSIADIIQLETLPAVPPKERAIVTYKIGWAMSERKKPIWSLHQPFYGFPYEGKVNLNISLVRLNQLYLAESYAAGVIPEVDLGGWPGVKGAVGLFVKKNGETYPELKKYLDFVKNNQEYFKNVEPCSRIGLVYSVPSFMWKNFPLFGIGYDEVRKPFVGYARALEEAHLQYDVLIFGMKEFWDDSETLKNLSNYDTLILPNMYSASNEHLRTLQGFIRKGGRLVCVGKEVLSRDEEYKKRSKSMISSVLGGRPGQVVFMDEKVVINFHDNAIEKGRRDVTGFNRLISAVSYKLDKLVETNAPRDVGVNILKQKDRVIIHFINYDYDVNSDSFKDKKDIEFTLGDKFPIKKVNKVTLISPDLEKTLCIGNPKGRLFTMPELKMWNTIIVE